MFSQPMWRNNGTQLCSCPQWLSGSLVSSVRVYVQCCVFDVILLRATISLSLLRATVITSADSIWLRVQGIGQVTFPAFSATCCFNAFQAYVGSGLFSSSCAPWRSWAWIISVLQRLGSTWVQGSSNVLWVPAYCCPSVYLMRTMPDQPDMIFTYHHPSWPPFLTHYCQTSAKT